MNDDRLNDLRDGLHALLAECDRLSDLAEAGGYVSPRAHISRARIWASRALFAADTHGLRAGIADTHAGRVEPWERGMERWR